VKVISPEISPRMKELIASGAVDEHLPRHFEPADVDGCRMVVAATDEPEVNRRVLDAADSAGVLCNVAGRGGRGHIQLPGSVTRGPLSISVSTSGASPSLTRRLRERLEGEFGPEWAKLVGVLSELRSEIQSLPPERRDQIVDTAIDGMPLAMLAGGADAEMIRDYLRRELES